MKQFEVEVSTNVKKGLGGRTSVDIPMLFRFRTDKIRGMWMHGMKVPIDIVWIRHDGMVLDLYSRVQTTDENVFVSSQPARFAIECAAGTAQRLGLIPGRRIQIAKQGESTFVFSDTSRM